MPRCFRAVLLAAVLLSIAAPVRAENILPNGGFDTGLSPWIPWSITPTWEPEDAHGSPESGSVRAVHDRLPSSGSVGISAAFSPCLSIEPGSHVVLADYRIPTGQEATGSVSIGFRWFSAPGCPNPPTGGTSTAELDSEESDGEWHQVNDTVTVPEGTASFTAELSIVRDQPGTFVASYDNVALCPEGTSCSTSPDGWITDPEYPDFRFRVEITPEGGAPIQGVREASCQPEVVCVSGALPGRSEVFLRVVGPRPNGYLWPTIVRFTPSRVDVEIEQLSTGQLRAYTLDAVPPGTETDLSGLQDREGFLP